MLTVLTALAMTPMLAAPKSLLTSQEQSSSIRLVSETIPRLASEAGAYSEVVRRHEVKPLPGQLDSISVFNSNSPEIIQQEGILLSTFPKAEMASPDAHLDYAFEGRFDIFAHHIARGHNPDDRRTLFLGVIVYNPGETPVTLGLDQGVTYLGQEAPFRDLPSTILNPNGTIYAGPGSRTTTDFLRGQNQTQWPEEVTIPPGHVHLLMNLPIPLRRLSVPVNGSYPQGRMIPNPPPNPVTLVADGTNAITSEASASKASPAANRPLPINGRSVLMHLNSSGSVHVASLAMYAPQIASGSERVPTLQEWIDLLKSSGLAGPRDIPPSNPATHRLGRFFYGRVAGVSEGSRWNATFTNGPDESTLSIPTPGDALSYVISTVDRNTFGTGQIQSAPMLVRYPDTAYRAHGNYGVHYSLRLPLENTTESNQNVIIKLQTPLQDESIQNQLRFWSPPLNRVFFRGTVRVRFTSPLGIRQTRYIHVVQRQGEEGEPLLSLNIPAGARHDVDIDFIYPPDSTPPQAITIRTMPQFDTLYEAEEPRLNPPSVSRDPGEANSVTPAIPSTFQPGIDAPLNPDPSDNNDNMGIPTE